MKNSIKFFLFEIIILMKRIDKKSLLIFLIFRKILIKFALNMDLKISIIPKKYEFNLFLTQSKNVLYFLGEYGLTALNN
jgi:hypothetical protein